MRKTLVTRYKTIGFSRDCGFQHRIVVGIAAAHHLVSDGDDFRAGTKERYKCLDRISRTPKIVNERFGKFGD